MKQLFRYLGSFPYYVFGLTLFFLTHGYSENVGLIPLSEMLIFLLISTIISIFLLWFFKKKMGSLIKAGIITGLILFFYLFYGALQDGFNDSVFLYQLSRYRVLLPGIIILTILLYFITKASKKFFKSLTLYINSLLLTLILFDLLSITKQALKSSDFDKEKNNIVSPALLPCDSCNKPDIYLIVMDEYWGTNMLKKYYGYDNHSFVSFLSGNGFHVLPHPSSNYTITPISMGATFEMKYASWLNGRKKIVAEDYGLVASKVISKSATIQFLKSMGYEIKNYSIFDIDDQPAAYNFQVLPIKMQLITSKTLPARMEKDLLWNIRMRIAYKFDWLTKKFQNQFKEGNKKIIGLTYEAINKHSTRPRFVYTHLLMPHLPCIYDSLGRDIFINYYRAGLSGKQHDDFYLQYLVYTNQIVKGIISEILKKSDSKAVIVLMSDHGYRYFSSTDTTLSGSSNFNAVFIPSKNYSFFYDSISNVNQFRALFNTLFNQRQPMLKDSVVF
jgi:hypothetical protein